MSRIARLIECYTLLVFAPFATFAPAELTGDKGVNYDVYMEDFKSGIKIIQHHIPIIVGKLAMCDIISNDVNDYCQRLIRNILPTSKNRKRSCNIKIIR